MKNQFINVLISILFSTCIALTTLYASDSPNLITFPVQPSFTYDSTQSNINPFGMTAFSIGNPYIRYHRHIGALLKETQWFHNKLSTNLELKIETPFYQPNTSLGLDCTFLMSLPWEDLGADSPFTSIMGGDMLATYKFKWPVYTAFGNFAGTITPKIGFVYIDTGTDHSTLYWKELGIVAGTSIGLDYYITQWFGVFAEYSIKAYRMQFLSLSPSNPERKPYHYFTSAITLGFKTTF
jgi:hypothetical protein